MNLGPSEIIVCLLIALLVLGPDKLPSAARQIGKAMAEFKRITSDVQGQVQTFINEEPEKGQSPGGPTEVPTTGSVALTKQVSSPPVQGQAGNAPSAVPTPAPESTPFQQHPGTDGFRLIDDNPPLIPDAPAPEPRSTVSKDEAQTPWRTFEKGVDDA